MVRHGTVQYGSLLGDLPLGTVPGTFLRVLSHLPHLVRLNRTRVRFPSWCGSFGQVRMQQSHSGAHQKRTKQVYRDLLEEVVSVRFQTDPGAVRLW